MTGGGAAHVVVAAGGLGTRVACWARFIPKEFYPVDGRPGVTHLLEEIAALGPARVVIVYHPYYEGFAAWARQALSEHGQARYARAARNDFGAVLKPGLAISFVPQQGPYADLTSVINGAPTTSPARPNCTWHSPTTSTASRDRCLLFAMRQPGGSPSLPAATSPNWRPAAASSPQPENQDIGS